MIFGVDVGFDDAGGRTGVVWCGPPRIVYQVHAPQLLENHTTPVLRRANRRQAALAVPAVLVAEYARLAQAIVAQSVRTKQPIAILVDCADRLLVRYRRPYQAVHVFYRLDFRFDDTHLTFTITPVSLSLCLSTFMT